MKKRTVAAADFKATCLKLMDQVEQEGGEIVITKRGRPVAKLVPYKKEKPESGFGCMKGTIKILGDIVAPLDEPWEVLED
jgi:prevent-host-death family protein